MAIGADVRGGDCWLTRSVKPVSESRRESLELYGGSKSQEERKNQKTIVTVETIPDDVTWLHLASLHATVNSYTKG